MTTNIKEITMGLMDKLNDKEKEFKEKFGGGIWNPEDGDILEGEVEELGTEKTQYRPDQPYLAVKQEDGKTLKMWCNAQLEGLCVDEDVEVGDMIAIKFLGARESRKTGKTYKNYILAKDNTPRSEREVVKVEEKPKKEKPKVKSIFDKE